MTIYPSDILFLSTENLERIQVAKAVTRKPSSCELKLTATGFISEKLIYVNEYNNI